MVFEFPRISVESLLIILVLQWTEARNKQTFQHWFLSIVCLVKKEKFMSQGDIKNAVAIDLFRVLSSFYFFKN